MSMRIETAPGEKVVYANPKNGMDHDKERADEFLTLLETYTVESLEVHSWYTDVRLAEFPGVVFNSVMFDNAEAGSIPTAAS